MNVEQKMIAHINEAGEEQSIEEHLLGTAKLAELFAEDFGCGKLGYLCGLLHDIGKYSSEFQNRIRDPYNVTKVDHSTAGALEAKGISETYLPVAMAIAGHHSGLLDGGNRKISTAHDGTFWGRMKSEIPNYSAWKKEIFLNKVVDGQLSLPKFCLENMFSMAFFIRMLYSCLVDADFLDTESFMTNGMAQRGGYESIDILLSKFLDYVHPWLSEHSKKGGSERNESLKKSRNQILKECLRKGKETTKGLYTLTVPTGGGKTTASMGFALQHMQTQGMRRVIYVIPYTSVIDQNASVFQKIFGEENVVEHHSGILYDAEEGVFGDKQNRKVLATENWDAPIIVTTAVQFFESLFGNKSSKCRKLHNLSNSVIIFDEAQTLPVPYLEPCIAAISELVKNYCSTVVLCTATQPALDEQFAKFMPGYSITELCEGVQEYFAVFQRTKIQRIETFSKEELISQLMTREQVLCIVNRRKTAQELYEQLAGEGVYCLTTLLCPAHRKEKFREIRDRLDQDRTCKVIATSLIEAGVDLDFPVVYRQEAGLDSLVQAAGRCNREGKRKVLESIVYSFSLEDDKVTYLNQNLSAMEEVWRRYEQPDSPEAIAFYFRFWRQILGQENLDQKEIMRAWEKGIDGNIFPYATVSSMFKLIDNDTRQVYIARNGTEELFKKVAYGAADRRDFRRLGQYVVNIYENHFRQLQVAGCLEKLGDSIYVLRDENQYREDVGLQLDVESGIGIFI